MRAFLYEASFQLYQCTHISYAYLSAADKSIFFFFISTFLIVCKLNTAFLDSKFVLYLLYGAQSQTQFISFWVIFTYCFMRSFGKLEMRKKCFDSTKQATGIQENKFTYEKKKEHTGNSTGTGENRCLIQTRKKKLSFGLHKANLKTKKKTIKGKWLHSPTCFTNKLGRQRNNAYDNDGTQEKKKRV